MRIIRSLFIILVAFAATALYIQGQYIYHNHEQGWWEAFKMLFIDSYPVTIIAVVILVGFVLLEWHFQKQEDNKNNIMSQKLDKILALLENKSNGTTKNT